MSYTGRVTPEDLKFGVSIENFCFVVSFTCPRCKAHVRAFIKPDEITDFDIECINPACRLPGERYGYKLIASMDIDGFVLGESDRPLHTENEICSYFNQVKH